MPHLEYSAGRTGLDQRMAGAPQRQLQSRSRRREILPHQSLCSAIYLSGLRRQSFRQYYNPPDLFEATGADNRRIYLHAARVPARLRLRNPYRGLAKVSVIYYLSPCPSRFDLQLVATAGIPEATIRG